MTDTVDARELVKTLFSARGVNLSEFDLNFAADLVDQFAEARAARAEQATKEAEEKRDELIRQRDFEWDARHRAESTLVAERGRVIEECAKIADKHSQQWAEFSEEAIAAEIRALAPPVAERKQP